MKTIKTIIFFTILITFASTSYVEAKECNYKSRVQQKICLTLGGLGSSDSDTSEKAEKVKKTKKAKKPIKSKIGEWNEENKTLSDLLKNN